MSDEQNIEDVVFDPDPYPHDATEHQLRTLPGPSPDSLSAASYTSEETVGLLTYLHRLSLLNLKETKRELAHLQETNRVLDNELSNLQTKFAVAQERLRISWGEMGITFLIGFASNLLTNNPTDGLGWAFLIFSVFVLLSLRVRDVSTKLEKLRGKGKDNDKKD